MRFIVRTTTIMTAVSNLSPVLLLVWASLVVTTTTSVGVQAFVPPVQQTAAMKPSTSTAALFPHLQTAASGRNHNNHVIMPMMMDPSNVIDSVNQVQDVLSTSSVTTTSTNMLLAFTDQGQNLAGIFFQASLLPYLLFLYFLSFRANRMPDVANFGFQFILLFVISTIPSGIISKSVYGHSLADTDWLHGGAEALLTTANVLVVLGLKEAMTKTETTPLGTPRNIALAVAGLFAVACTAGPSLWGGHAPFLGGLGDLSNDATLALPWVSHSEPINALTIPTWAIHFSSVFEYLFAMNLVWQFADATENPKWKGLTWGMLPLHASGICACTYHFFYNPSALQFLVSSQAGLTLLGNITCMIGAFRIAQSNGWTIGELNPFRNAPTSPDGLVADGLAQRPLVLQQTSTSALADTSSTILAAQLIGLTLLTSYAVKYGELGLDLPFTPNAPVATAMILGIPAVTAVAYYTKSQADAAEQGDDTSLNPLASFGFSGSGEGDGPSLSMADIKKYGVAGTVAYVLTEVAFWAIAFPVAAVALYQSTGHWPDVVADNTDRAAVLGFIFAGANIARAAVPLRFGAALALAPWVEENVLGGSGVAEDV